MRWGSTPPAVDTPRSTNKPTAAAGPSALYTLTPPSAEDGSQGWHKGFADFSIHNCLEKAASAYTIVNAHGCWALELGICVTRRTLHGREKRPLCCLSKCACHAHPLREKPLTLLQYGRCPANSIRRGKQDSLWARRARP